jgi:hypothetical protein
MNIDQWAQVVHMPEKEHLDVQVQQAQQLGKENYGAVVAEILERVLATPEFGALTGALVIGNAVLDAQPQVNVELDEGVTLRIGFKTP